MKLETKKQILATAEKLGLRALKCLLRGLVRVLYPSDKWRDLLIRVRHLTQRESAQAKFNRGVDEAIRENLSPEEAVDRLAKKSGISKKIIKASKLAAPVTLASVGIRHVPLREDLPTDEEIFAKRIALEEAIAASIKKS